MKTAAEQIRESIIAAEKRQSELEKAVRESAALVAELAARAAKLAEPKRFKVGDKVRIIDGSGHGFRVGDIVTIIAEEGGAFKEQSWDCRDIMGGEQLIRDSQIEPAPERIRVPENIKFRYEFNQLRLISPNGKCELGACLAHGGTPCVVYAGKEYNAESGIVTDPLYLEPCKREDLKCGDWAVSFDSLGIDIAKSNIEYYGCILNDREHAKWYGEMNTKVVNCSVDYWYKVVR